MIAPWRVARGSTGRCQTRWRLALLFMTLLMLTACAGFEAGEVDVDTFRQRAIVHTQGSITISAAVPDAQETEQLTGLDLYDQGIQPVWLEATNDGDSPVRLALWRIDRDYFSPIEVAYMNRQGLSDAGEADMQRWFYDTRLQRMVEPGATRSGFVYTHRVNGTKGFNVDVYANRQAHHFTFFVPMPGFVADYSLVDFDALYGVEEVRQVDPDDVLGLYTILQEQTVCCSTDEHGDAQGNPLNVVLIGSGLAVRRAMLRGGWQETEAVASSTVRARAHHYRGRPADAIFHKYRPDGGERKELRLWLTPDRVNDDWIWLGQVSDEISTTGKAGDFADYYIDPDIDGSRRFTAQNLWYSQSVARIGLTGGASASSAGSPRRNFHGEDYFSDGHRVVLWLSEMPVAMDETVIENLLQIPLK
jgi:hypothetical protein